MGAHNSEVAGSNPAPATRHRRSEDPSVSEGALVLPPVTRSVTERADPSPMLASEHETSGNARESLGRSTDPETAVGRRVDKRRGFTGRERRDFEPLLGGTPYSVARRWDSSSGLARWVSMAPMTWTTSTRRCRDRWRVVHRALVTVGPWMLSESNVRRCTTA
jgi:hypothetical protein